LGFNLHTTTDTTEPETLDALKTSGDDVDPECLSGVKGREAGCPPLSTEPALSKPAINSSGNNHHDDASHRRHDSSPQRPKKPYFGYAMFETNMENPILLGLLGLLSLLFLASGFWPESRPLPPTFKVLRRALSGEFDMATYGVSRLLRSAYNELGGTFRIEIPGKPCTFLIGKNAVQTLFDAKNESLSPREAYQFMNPVFGPGVVYAAPWERMAAQLSFVKHGLSEAQMQAHPARLQAEVKAFLATAVPDESGELELYSATSELIINTASRCLLGDEIRDHVHEEFAQYYFMLEKAADNPNPKTRP